MHHATIKLSLKEEGDEEPINANETVMRALIEEQYDCHHNGEGRLEDDVHISEQSEDQTQVHVLQLNYLRLWDAITTLLSHTKRLRY